mmetsp:Transcript_13685/g.27309  ORF Transcript_13685/g.27309 Transcript_13685/m.27309 type:complete len:216 (-) Transcript_13685:110-757(-)
MVYLSTLPILLALSIPLAIAQSTSPNLILPDDFAIGPYRPTPAESTAGEFISEECITIANAQDSEGIWQLTLSTCNRYNNKQFFRAGPSESFISVFLPGWCLGSRDNFASGLHLVKCRPNGRDANNQKKPFKRAVMHVFDDRDSYFQQVFPRVNAYKAWEVVEGSPRTVRYAPLKHVSTFDADSIVEGVLAASLKVMHPQNFWYWYRSDFDDYGR